MPNLHSTPQATLTAKDGHGLGLACCKEFRQCTVNSEARTGGQIGLGYGRIVYRWVEVDHSNENGKCCRYIGLVGGVSLY